ncbi:hypothetical protein EV128_117130 [Rhizobium azibense]|nr:hypothetical protein EV128_117130 [Rhizobium azibense]
MNTELPKHPQWVGGLRCSTRQWRLWWALFARATRIKNVTPFKGHPRDFLIFGHPSPFIGPIPVVDGEQSSGGSGKKVAFYGAGQVSPPAPERSDGRSFTVHSPGGGLSVPSAMGGGLHPPVLRPGFDNTTRQAFWLVLRHQLPQRLRLPGLLGEGTPPIRSIRRCRSGETG